MSAIYYVYMYRDPRDGKNRIPVYVGMGKGKRAWQHLTRASNPGLKALITKAKVLGLDMQPEIVVAGLTQFSALAKEVELVELYGRRDLGTGSLYNLTRGGDGAVELSKATLIRRNKGIKAAHSTPEAKVWHSNHAYKIWSSPMGDILRERAKKFNSSEEGKAILKAAWARKGGHEQSAKDAIGAATREYMADPEYKAAWLAKQIEGCRTDEAKINKSNAVKAGWSNEDTRRKRSEGIKAARSTEESRAKTRAQQEAQWTNEAKKKASDFAKERLKDPLTKARSSVANAYTWAVRKGLPFSHVSFPRKSI